MNWSAKNVLALICILTLAAGVVGCSSDSTEPNEPPDTTSPSVVGVTATDANRVEVVFSEAVDKTSAEDPANYKLVEQTPTFRTKLDWRTKPEAAAPGDVKNVIAAALDANGAKVVLTTEALSLFTPYALEVEGVSDVSGNGISLVAAPVADKILAGKIFTVCGNGLAALGAENVDPTLSELYLPQDVTVAPSGLLYVADWNNHRIRVIENGLIRTIIGTGILGDADEGNALEVGLNHPTNVSFGPNGNLYMAAWHNSKIMKYDMTTGFLSIYCGWAGARGWFGDGDLAYDAIINLPSSTVWGPDGNLYISDQANHCVRMIDFNTNIITTVVASQHKPGFSGDGGAAIDALLRAPSGQSADPSSRIQFDAAGNLYLCDTSNHRVRWVDTSGDPGLPLADRVKAGIIHTIIGNGVPGYSGDGGDATAAQINWPADLAIDPITGNLYFADKNNHRVRMLDRSTGIITTVVGNGMPGYLAADEGKRATEARLYEPWGICFDSQGNLYVADTKNQRIRVVYR